MKRVKLCEDCNSEIITVKQGRKVSVECSYCGKPYGKETSLEDIDFSDYGDNDGEV